MSVQVKVFLQVVRFGEGGGGGSSRVPQSSRLVPAYKDQAFKVHGFAKHLRDPYSFISLVFQDNYGI